MEGAAGPPTGAVGPFPRHASWFKNGTFTLKQGCRNAFLGPPRRAGSGGWWWRHWERDNSSKKFPRLGQQHFPQTEQSGNSSPEHFSHLLFNLHLGHKVFMAVDHISLLWNNYHLGLTNSIWLAGGKDVPPLPCTVTTSLVGGGGRSLATTLGCSASGLLLLPCCLKHLLKCIFMCINYFSFQRDNSLLSQASVTWWTITFAFVHAKNISAALSLREIPIGNSGLDLWTVNVLITLNSVKCNKLVFIAELVFWGKPRRRLQCG